MGGGSSNSGYGSKSGGSSTYTKGTNLSSADKIRQQTSTKFSSRPDAGSSFKWSSGSAKNTTQVKPGIGLSAADRIMGGYRQYQQATVPKAQQNVRLISAWDKDQSRIPQSPLSPMKMAKSQDRLPQETTPGWVARYYGPEDAAAGDIEARVASRVAASPGPLRGSSWQGRLAASMPTQSPMAGQGAPGFGPLSPFAAKYDAGKLRSQYDKFALGNTPGLFGSQLADTLGPNYGTGYLGPQSGPETRPDPTSGPAPSQKYNVADSFRGGVNPSQERSPVPSFLTNMPGPIGAIAGGVNWLSNLPGDGATNQFARDVNDMRPGMMWDGGRGGSVQAAEAPKTATGAVNPLAAASAPPVGMTYPKFMYPDYTQQWAGLPRGLYGRG
jgi:hypothetical protein